MVAHISNQTIPVLLAMLAHLALCLNEFYLVTKLDRLFSWDPDMKQPLSTNKEWFESAGYSSSLSITLTRCSSPGFWRDVLGVSRLQRPCLSNCRMLGRLRLQPLGDSRDWH